MVIAQDEAVDDLGKTLHWLILGIGSKGTDSFQEHLDGFHQKQTKTAFGDIASRLFDKNGDELGANISSHFALLELKHLAEMAEDGEADQPVRTRVMAVAGGKKKVDAIAVVLRKRPRLINYMITDEMTAERLIRELQKPPIALAADE